MTEMWTRPMAEVQQFAANEYVAACGESGVVYKFKCDAPGGRWVGLIYNYFPVYMYKNNNPVKLVNGNLLDSYHACGEAHEAESSDDFYKGFIDRNENGREDNGEAVIIWRGPDGDNVHCTTNLDMTKWETVKS